MRRSKTCLIHPVSISCALVFASFTAAPAQRSSPQVSPLYRRSSAPIGRRIDDLMLRMTLAEKVRQLDLYPGAKALVNTHTDDTHAAPEAAFMPEQAQELFGTLGVGGIHDLYPTPKQANAIQQWVITHNRFGIPALFIEEALH
jgi:beta-glucosidase